MMSYNECEARLLSYARCITRTEQLGWLQPFAARRGIGAALGERLVRLGMRLAPDSAHLAHPAGEARRGEAAAL
jgi:hypothetical protein